MSPDTITHHFARSGRHPSTNLIKSLISSKIVQQHPVPFASALAHEVRNPLTNINLAVEMLQSTLMDSEQKMYLDIIMRGSVRIDDLVTDLLVTSQAIEMPPESHSIHQLLDEVLVMTKDRIRLKNISIRKDYTSLDCKILANKEKIKIAITNIVINAIDAMPPEGGKLKLVTRSVNGKCIIEIEDNGTGISAENQQKIFKPYFTNKPAGLGLGLSATQEILLSDHAMIDVRSEPGKGTCFILSFDRVQSSVETVLTSLF